MVQLGNVHRNLQQPLKNISRAIKALLAMRLWVVTLPLPSATLPSPPFPSPLQRGAPQLNPLSARAAWFIPCNGSEEKGRPDRSGAARRPPPHLLSLRLANTYRGGPYHVIVDRWLRRPRSISATGPTSTHLDSPCAQEISAKLILRTTTIIGEDRGWGVGSLSPSSKRTSQGSHTKIKRPSKAH